MTTQTVAEVRAERLDIASATETAWVDGAFPPLHDTFDHEVGELLARHGDITLEDSASGQSVLCFWPLSWEERAPIVKELQGVMDSALGAGRSEGELLDAVMDLHPELDPKFVICAYQLGRGEHWRTDRDDVVYPTNLLF